MKYVWIIMLGILYISWAIMSVKDCIDTYRYVRECIIEFHGPIKRFLLGLQLYTIIFVIIHIVALFVYSLSQYVGKPPIGQPLYLVVDSNIKMF